MAAHVGVEPLTIRSAIAGLVGRGLIAVQPGAGQRPNEYLLALPKRSIAAMAAVAADDGPPI